MVKLVPETLIEALLSATLPVKAAVPLSNCRAPLPSTPVPMIVMFSASVTPSLNTKDLPEYNNVIPAVVPKALSWAATTVPPRIFVMPL